MKDNVIVIGGGTAGMEAAGQLANAGLHVTVIEKEKKEGGHAGNWYHLFPDRRPGDEVIDYLNKRVEHNNIRFKKGVAIESINRNNGEFIVTSDGGDEYRGNAIVVATGFDLFRSERKEEYGYGIYENVITSADLEQMFRNNELKLASGKAPERIGFIHCVGSRDEKVGNFYCSKLCCVTAVKQAIEIKEHLPASKVFCFYMDIRMGGAQYEELYMESQEKYGVNFIRGKVSEVAVTINNTLVIKAEDTLAGRPLKMELDMLVLMAGMEMSEGGMEISRILGLSRGDNRFFESRDNHYGSNLSNVDGVFLAGTCVAPMNITETISHARAAVSDVIEYLKIDKIEAE